MLTQLPRKKTNIFPVMRDPRSACGEKASPLGGSALALRAGPVDVLGSDAEDGGEGPARVAKDGGPEVGDSCLLGRSR